MTEKVSFGISLTRDARDIADQMIKDDVRPSMSNFLEWLIRKEHRRRQQPARTPDEFLDHLDRRV